MKYLITESQYNKFFKGGPDLQSAVIQYLNNMMNGANRKVKPKSRNYGNLREDWCKDGKEIMSAHYYFGEPDGEDNIKNKNFYNGQVYINEKIVNTISKLLNLRVKYILHVISEWYDETYAQKFAKEMNEPHLHIDDAEVLDKEYPCAPDIAAPEDISEEEMIEYIVKNTLWKRDEVVNIINNGERDLKDFYLDILETVDNRERYGF